MKIKLTKIHNFIEYTATIHILMTGTITLLIGRILN